MLDVLTAKQIKLWEMLEPTLDAMGYELVHIQLRESEHYGLLRIYADKEDGFGLSDCETISRQVSALLDVEDPINGPYTLEVSSPGLDRPLVKREHFERFVGSEVKVRLISPIRGRRNFVGKLIGVVGDEVIVEADNERWQLPLTVIDSARLVPEF